MRKLKYGLWAIFVALIGLLVYQNKVFFLTKHSLGLDIGVYNNQTPEIFNIVIIAAFFLCGILITYSASLFERYKARKTIKTLQGTIDASSSTIADLRKEVDAMKVGWEPEPDSETSTEETAKPLEDEETQPTQV